MDGQVGGNAELGKMAGHMKGTVIKADYERVGWIGWHDDEPQYAEEGYQFFTTLGEGDAPDTWHQVPVFVVKGSLDDHPLHKARQADAD